MGAVAAFTRYTRGRNPGQRGGWEVGPVPRASEAQTEAGNPLKGRGSCWGC